jgi:hypothetical protein
VPQNYLPRPKKESATTQVFCVILMVALSTGVFLFDTWPARPRTWIGWGLTALLSGPLLVLGEFVGQDR